MEFTGGNVQISQGTAKKGQYSLKFEHPGGAGNGGGTAESDYFAMSVKQSIAIGQTFWTDQTGVRVKVQIDYFDEDKLFISNETLYNEVLNTTSIMRLVLHPTIPNGASYLKYKFVGGSTGDDPGSLTTIHLDNVHVNGYDDGSIVQRKLGYEPGSEIIASNDTVASTNLASYTKVKETVAARFGTLTIYHEFRKDTGAVANAYTKIYVNGSAVGSENSTTSTAFQAVSEDIEVEVDDLVQIYAKKDGGAGLCEVRNFRFLNLEQIYEVNTLT